jgi:hypothetical protein
MTDSRSETVSVVERTYAVAAAGAVIATHFLGHTAVFVLGEETMVFAEPKGEPRRVAVHDGSPRPQMKSASCPVATTAS